MYNKECGICITLEVEEIDFLAIDEMMRNRRRNWLASFLAGNLNGHIKKRNREYRDSLCGYTGVTLTA